MSERPALPKLKRGDAVHVIQRDGRTDRHIVTGVGPTWIRMVPPKFFGDVIEEKRRERRFLLADQKEGLPSKRVGIPTRFATDEQLAHDDQTATARIILANRGLTVGPGPFKDRDAMIRLANVVLEMWPDV